MLVKNHIIWQKNVLTGLHQHKIIPNNRECSQRVAVLVITTVKFSLNMHKIWGFWKIVWNGRLLIVPLNETFIFVMLYVVDPRLAINICRFNRLAAKYILFTRLAAKYVHVRPWFCTLRSTYMYVLKLGQEQYAYSCIEKADTIFVLYNSPHTCKQ